KHIPFERFIMALCIKDVGKTTARSLAARLPKHEVLFDLDTPEKVLALKVADIGKSTAANIANYFANPKKKADAIRLYKSLIIDEVGEITPIVKVEGKTFVFTGKFSEPREILEGKVISAGGRVSSSVSVKTDYCVVGEKPGSSA